MNKKIIAFVTALLMTISTVTVFAAKENIFPDVGENNFAWAADAINEMVELSVIKGYTDGTFKPERSITKAEALVLASRIMGYTNEDNLPFAEFASELYAETLSDYDAKYPGEVAFLLYKGVLSDEELDLYIGEENANAPLKRYEAAVLMTKIMAAEQEAKEQESAKLTFKDAADIPEEAKGYVKYVYDEGLMQGMSDTEFVPMYEVNRAQMSVMLYRVMQKMEQNIIVGTLQKVDADDRTITYINDAGKTKTMNIAYDDELMILQDGYEAELDELEPYSLVAIIERADGLYSIETLTVEGDMEFEGILYSVQASARTIKVYPMDNTSKTEEYKLAKNVAVVREGKSATLAELGKQDYIFLKIVDGEVAVIEAYEKEVTVRGTVSDIILEPDVFLEVTVSSGDTEYYGAADEVSVNKNSKTASFGDILIGDRVTLTVRYGKIVAISASSTNSSISGIIDSITIATMPSIKIKEADSSSAKSYSLSRDAKYVIDGKEGDIYSLRLGASVTVNLESDTVVKVTSNTPTVSAAQVGVIESINKSYGFLVMSQTEADGSVTQMQVFLKKSGIKIINSSTGKEITTAGLQAGQTISVTGVMNTGAFEASTIIVLP